MFVSRATRLHWHMFAIRTHTHIHKTLLNRCVPNHKPYECVLNQNYVTCWRIESNLISMKTFSSTFDINNASWIMKDQLNSNSIFVLCFWYFSLIQFACFSILKNNFREKNGETKRKATNAHTHSYRNVNKQKKKKNSARGTQCTNGEGQKIRWRWKKISSENISSSAPIGFYEIVYFASSRRPSEIEMYFFKCFIFHSGMNVTDVFIFKVKV